MMSGKVAYSHLVITDRLSVPSKLLGMAARKSPFFNTATTLGKVVAFFGVSALCGVLTAGLMVPIASLAGSTASVGVEVFDALPSDLKGERISQPSKILAKDGSTIATFYAENRTPVPLKKISPAMRKAIVAIEDERFYEHNGVDLRGITRATVNNITSSSRQGASTLTQQYVNNLLLNADEINGVDRAERTISGTDGKDYAAKLREVKYALSIEKEMSKDQILAGYLNLVLFSGRNYGIQAAAQRFYSVDAKDLNIQQSAMLAGMVQLPNVYNPITNPKTSLKRRNTVLAAMLKTEAITQKQYDKAVKTKLGLKPTETKSGCIAADSAAYFCDYVTKLVLSDSTYGKTPKDRENLLYRGGLKITTTLDPRLQKQAERETRNMVPANDSSNIGAAIVTVEPGSGNILAMGQNKDYSLEPGRRNTTFNFAVDRTMGGAGGFQGGSTMKPYTTLAWLEAGNNMWDKIQSPVRTWSTSYRWKASCLPSGSTNVGSDWTPQNAVKGYPTSMTVDYGLLNSVNTATIAEASQLDLCDIANATTRLGVLDYDNNIDPKTGEVSNYGQPISAQYPSFLIGSARITPLAQATAFAAFANDGEFCDNRAIKSVVDSEGNTFKVKPVTCKQEVDPRIVANMNGTMKKIANDKIAHGAINAPIAGKTGTNNGATSTWFVGYTTGMSTAAWVGRWDKDTMTPTFNVPINGVARSWVDSHTFAGPMWVNYMRDTVNLYPSKKFGSPDAAPRPAAPKPDPSKDTSKDSEKDDNKVATASTEKKKDDKKSNRDSNSRGDRLPSTPVKKDGKSKDNAKSSKPKPGTDAPSKGD